MLIILFLSQFLWAQDPHLEGVWRQPCLNQALRTEDFKGTSVTFTESYFADKVCGERLLDFTSLGAFAAKSGKIDFAFSQINITLHNIHYVDDYNDRQVCGISTWQVGKAENVTGKFCEIFGPGVGLQIPPQGQMRYGIYKIEEKRLYFGRLSLEHDSSSPEKRPQEFDERFFTRQN
ncbi:hypothetical protein AZI86_04460 [Bdellovibrio bacteriovorus]|uniref:APCDD1 domain-containing protein n=1 Tax=Bdellovibrio bacteriovorus TaxID=959 RepID=A0A150WPR3_BDEBC|nr:hypothetical protein [Bdellovibrio bacteriovorus]KYG66314.1 hypothetical protein AZI86_04460 [Bdellovibrio bacteriovorus]